MERVLLIDDDPDFCHLVRLGLPRRGDYEVTTAHTLASGLALAQTGTFHVILLDRVIPPFTSTATLAMIPEFSQHAPVIIVSGWPYIGEAIHRGAVGYVVKEAGRLFEKLDTAIRARPSVPVPPGYLTIKELQSELATRGLPSSRPWVTGILQRMRPGGVLANRARIADLLTWLEKNPAYKIREPSPTAAAA